VSWRILQSHARPAIGAGIYENDASFFEDKTKKTPVSRPHVPAAFEVAD